METLLHIGMPKTGSTALQETLLASHDALLRHGVLYPRVPDPTFNNHRLLLVGTTALRKLPRHIRRSYTEAELDSRKAEFLHSVRADLRTHAPRALVLSSESLFRHFSPEGQKVLLAGLRKVGMQPEATRVVAYVRRPSDRYLSGLQQHLKASWKVLPPEPAHYRQNLQQYEQIFGSAAVSVIPFRREALIGADIVTDFLTRFLSGYGVDRAGMAPVGAVNESLSAEGIDIQRSYRDRFHHDDDDRHTPDSIRLFKALQAIDAELGASRPRLVEGIADLVDYSGTDALWLRDHLGVEFPDYDYARLERGDLAVLPGRGWRLDDVMQIDRARQAAMLDRLAADPWCAVDAARRSWVADLRRNLPDTQAKPQGRAPTVSLALPVPDALARQDVKPEGARMSATRPENPTAKPEALDRDLLAEIAKALWKAEQKAANPAIAPEALKTGWKAARKERIEATRPVLKAIARAGYQVVKAKAAPEAPGSDD